MTDRQTLGVIVRGFGVYFFTSAVRQASDAIYMLVTWNSIDQPREHFLLPNLITVCVVWFALSFALIRYADWIVRVAYEWIAVPGNPSSQDSMLDAG